MNYLIKNGKALVNGQLTETDLFIENGFIVKIAPNQQTEGSPVIDAAGKIVSPGFIDMHTHLRDPGQIYKEDIVTGTAAAAKGGFTTICAMPNTEPVVDNIATVEYIRRKAADLGYARVHVIGALTKKSEGKEIAEMATMQDGGIVAVSDDGRCVQNTKLKLNCMKYASNFDLPVIVHPEDYDLAGSGQINAGIVSTRLGLSGISPLAEEIIISRDIMLAASAGCHLHIAHISTAKSVEMVRKAKEQGVNITCEVTPHHLILTEDACATFDTNTKVKPPLRTENDRQACLAGLIDGTIDCIATDHAPHADYEKELEFNLAPFGINGFEAAFCSMYDKLVKPGHLQLATLLNKLTAGPADLLKLNAGHLVEGKPADITIIDLEDSTEITAESMLSKSKNTPWLGHNLAGKVTLTMCGGRITWQA